MARHAGQTLLPPNVTAIEKASSLTSAAAREGIPIEDLPKVFDPWLCPARLLPWLAHHLSVDLWDDRWTETRKRRMCANAIRLARLKGTETGLREFLDYVDASVVSLTTPPGMFFLGRQPTKDERERWIARLPQIRLSYPIQKGTNVGFFLGAGWLSQTGFTPATPDALRKRARYFVAGAETDVEVENVLVDTWRVFLKRRTPTGGFLGSTFLSAGNLGRTTARDQVLTITPERTPFGVDSAGDRLPITPSLRPVTARPEVVPIPHVVRGAVRHRAPFSARFFVPNDARSFIYDRVAVVDPAISLPPNDLGGGFLTADRFGVPAHTVEVRIKTEHRDPAFVLGESAIGDFLMPNTAPDRVKPILRALQAWKRKSDRVLFTTQSRDLPRIGEGVFIAGEALIAGTQIEIEV